MAESPAPTTFRLAPEERALLEAVAHANGRTLSAYVREAALAAARGYLAQEGVEKVLERDREYMEERSRTSSRIADHKKALLDEAPATENSDKH
jgi:uncharacterized protein (DUF1778 family)